MTAHSLRLTAYGPDEDEIGVVEGAAEADSLRLAAFDGCSAGKRPERLAFSRRPMALPNALAYELYRLTEDEIRIVEGGLR